MKVLIDGIEYAPIAPLVERGHAFPELMRMVRKLIGYDLEEAAGCIGCSKSYLWGLENEKHDPSLRVAGKISQAYGVPIENLWRSLDATRK